MEININFMELAINKAKEGVSNGQSPFGACIVKNGEIIALEHNLVRATIDSTAHAEVVAIRAACKAINSVDLTDSIIYSTCEPCPMCFGAIHWARIGTIVYGATIDDAKKAGFNELVISNKKLKELAEDSVKIIDNILPKECQDLFKLWLNNPTKFAY